MNFPQGPFFEHFSVIADPRLDRKKLHKLIDILVITLCAVICGAETWEDIERFGEAKYEWFKTFLELPNGVPSHDTLWRVFSLLDPEQFEKSFIEWMKSCVELSAGTIIPIDGKRLRASNGSSLSNKAAIHMVSAFSSANGLVLGQRKIDDKSNEITAIPKLLETLYLKGCIVTIDAMGCQKNIAEKIISQGADYVLALKENHKNLYDDVKLYLDTIADNTLKNVPHQIVETNDKGHGRVEARRYYITEAIDWLEGKKLWKNLKSIGMVESERSVNNITSIERRYFLTSLSENVDIFSNAVRVHWSIENNLHWVLDVAFGDDKSKTCAGDSAENLAIVRRIGYNVVKQDPKKRSIRGKRLDAGWDNDYLMTLLLKVFTF
jgi:predicted transposase YbfD/YdcC